MKKLALLLMVLVGVYTSQAIAQNKEKKNVRRSAVPKRNVKAKIFTAIK